MHVTAISLQRFVLLPPTTWERSVSTRICSEAIASLGLRIWALWAFWVFWIFFTGLQLHGSGARTRYGGAAPRYCDNIAGTSRATTVPPRSMLMNVVPSGENRPTHTSV